MDRVIVMMGPPLDGRGGISSVAAAYRDGGLLAKYGVRYIATVGDGSRVSKLWHALRALLALLALGLGRRLRLVHIHMSSGPSFWRKAAMVWAARVCRAPVVLHIHGGNFAEWAREQAAPVRWFIRATLKAAVRTVVLSPAWKARLQGWVPAQRFVVIQNAIAPMPGREPQARPARRFLFLGRLETDKGIDVLLDAFAAVHRRIPDARLVLCGDGDRERVARRAAELGIAPAVETPGWLLGAQKAAVLQAADAFVLPSFIEGLPMSMLEAMQAGIPVVVTSVGSVPEVIEGGRNGLLVPAGDAAALSTALLRLATEPDLVRTLALAGFETYRTGYSVAAIDALLGELWREAAAR